MDAMAVFLFVAVAVPDTEHYPVVQNAGACHHAWGLILSSVVVMVVALLPNREKLR